MTKQQILDEIKRTAELNGRTPLGRQRFFQETGIKESDWSGRYWARWVKLSRRFSLDAGDVQAFIRRKFYVSPKTGASAGDAAKPNCSRFVR